MSYDDIQNSLIISELAQEMETQFPIDWGDLNVSEQLAYELVANQVYEKFKDTENIKGERLVLLASIVRVVVENFTLNLKLLKMSKNTDG